MSFERASTQATDRLYGYDKLEAVRSLGIGDLDGVMIGREDVRQAFDQYNKIHKVLVNDASAPKLEEIFYRLKDEDLPGYLNAAGWAAAEAALVADSMPAIYRSQLVEDAADCWTRAIAEKEQINHSEAHEYMREDVESYRLALNLAYVPMMQAMIAGNVTDQTRSSAFCDVLSITQLARVQRSLAKASTDSATYSGYVGFEHECNAHLGILFLDDSRYIPLPATARAGEGYDYPDQTHDLMVINQHWGKILKTIPVEVKARATLRDLKRYEALVVRGKMHLSYPGRYDPGHTTDAYAAYYDGSATEEQTATVYRSSQTIKELLKLYQKGKKSNRFDSLVSFHDRTELARVKQEFSFDRGQ